MLSDDGARLVEGVECKRLKEPHRKFFRARRIDRDALGPATTASSLE